MTRLKASPIESASATVVGALSTIVVATDFSENAEHALRWAISLAKPHGAKIVILHALEPTISAIDLLEGPITTEARRQLSTSEHLVKEAKLRSITELERGRAWIVLADAAKRHHADLIVIGTRGRTRYKRVLLGSTADRLVRTSPVPVLVIHPGDAAPSDSLLTILVPIDFSEESALATSMAVRMLSGHEGRGGRAARLILLHVVELMVEWPTPDVPTVLPRYWDQAELAAKRQLESIAAGLRNEHLQVGVKTVRGSAPDVIEQVARSMGADLIAMGTRGSNGLYRLMIGSVAASVLQHVACPVLTVRKPDPDEPIQVESRAN